MSIATPSTITACALTAGHSAEVRSTGRPVVDPSVRYPTTTNSSSSPGKNPEDEGVIYTIIDNNRGLRGPANISGDRLRNRRSDSPIPQRPRRWKIGSQPPAIAMGRNAHRRGTTTRESALRRRRAAMTTMSPHLSCNGCGITTVSVAG
ncbi:hypothetical protein DBV08_18340 [Rhodococcus sp. KBW08]|uniref:hypothetical protein n=1 Tax=Rhodococcus sp. KBW08 TaxID=2144188 RepID=UPI000F5A7BB6|nr:hypothetical protein [Rhodococcus sp. KBW08]RQO46101.1 hypothetical protein DBV08_18340 [Rhodococcus sp. KBW08]